MLRRNQGMNHGPRDYFLGSGSHLLQGKVYDVTGNKMYQPGNSYNGKLTQSFNNCSFPNHPFPSQVSCVLTSNASGQVFAGKDASRALGKTSTSPDDVSPEWKDLSEKEKGTLNDWVKFFSNRYNVVGTVEGATNFDDEPAAEAAEPAASSS